MSGQTHPFNTGRKLPDTCLIWDFLRPRFSLHTLEKRKIWSLLFWYDTQRILIISYRRFGTTSRSSLQRSKDWMTLEDWRDNLSRNDGNYQCTLHNIPEKGRAHSHRGGSLKPRKREILSPLPEIKQGIISCPLGRLVTVPTTLSRIPEGKKV